MAARTLRIPLDPTEAQVLSIHVPGVRGPFKFELNGTELGVFASLKEARTGATYRLSDGRTLLVRTGRHGWEPRIDGRLAYGIARDQHGFVWKLWLVGAAAVLVGELLESSGSPDALPYILLDLAINTTLALLFYNRWRPAAWIGAGMHVLGFLLEWIGFVGAASMGEFAHAPIAETVLVVILREPWFNAKWMTRVLTDLAFYQRRSPEPRQQATPLKS